METIKVKYLDENPFKLHKIEKGDWIDIQTPYNIELKAGEFKLIPLGIAIQLPKGYEAHLAPRSSTFKKWGLIQTNSIGIIDESYCGEGDQWMIPVLATRDTEIKLGDRICQFRIFPKQSISIEEVEMLNNENRGGFGSTGN